MTSPRIRPVQPDEMDVVTEELLAGMKEPQGANGTNAFATLVRHEKFFKRFTSLGGVFIHRGTLTARRRELLILRTAYRCGSSYNWGQHAAIAAGEHLSVDDIAALAGEIEPHSWSPVELALLHAADELHDAAMISAPVWQALAKEYDDRQLIEICALVGFYHMSSFLLNSLCVELDDNLIGLPI